MAEIAAPSIEGAILDQDGDLYKLVQNDEVARMGDNDASLMPFLN